MRLLAIDPASYKCGIALFENGKLILTQTLVSSEKTPLDRRLDMARMIENVTKHYGPQTIVSEEPLILGRNNNGFQRLLGYFELLTRGTIHFYHPMTVKKALGAGTLDKLEVALAAGESLGSEEEKEIIADSISREAFDESDAIAVALTYFKNHPNDKAT